MVIFDLFPLTSTESTNTQSTLKKNYIILKTNCVKELHYLGRDEDEELVDLYLPTPNTNKLRAKEEKVLRNLREEAARIGVGVSREAQEIFNGLSKTYAF